MSGMLTSQSTALVQNPKRQAKATLALAVLISKYARQHRKDQIPIFH